MLKYFLIYHHSLIFTSIKTFTEDISSIWNETKTIPEVGTLLNKNQYEVYSKSIFQPPYFQFYV